MNCFAIKPENRRRFFSGIVLVIIGVLMPLLIDVHSMGIYKSVQIALSKDREVYLLGAATQLWGMNTVRALPVYLGAFYMAETVNMKGLGSCGKVLQCLMTGLLIIGVYQLIELFYDIHYDIGVPAVSMIFILVIFVRIDLSLVATSKKTLVVAFMLCAFQCLDVMPLLSGYGFGRGETSRMIKDVANFMEAETALNFGSLMMLVLMSINFLLYFLLVIDDNHIKRVNREKEQKNKELIEVRIKALQARTQIELEQLVHDLKTPLTSVLTLVGVLKLTPKTEKELEYLSSIETSVENLSGQISEILDEQCMTKIQVEELIRGLLAQISPMPYARYVDTNIIDANLWVEVNRIRFCRALINLLENAYYVIDRETGSICIQIRRSEDRPSMVEFSVIDNGSGMSDDVIAAAFTMGYSGRGSSGLGLNFVRSVVESHGGEIYIESEPMKGTRVVLLIAEGDKNEE